METHNRSWFIQIPASVLDDERLDDATVLLFGRISSLTYAEGYCYATDKYLAELTKVSVKELQKRLKHLEDCGHITRETQKVGMKWDRKIFSNYNYEASVRRSSKPPYGGDRNLHTAGKYIKDNIQIRQQQQDLAPEGASADDVPFHKCLKIVNMEDSLKEKLTKEFPDENKVDQAVEAMKKSPTDIENPYGWLSSCLKRGGYEIPQTKEEKIASKEDFIEKHLKPWDGKKLGVFSICVGKSYVEFTNGSNFHRFEALDKEFEEKVVETFEKFGVKLDTA